MAYKRRHGLSLNVWEATSLLISALNSWKRAGIWYVGFNKKRFYPGTRAQVLNVARYVEYGTLRMPPRPLFRSIQKSFERDMVKYMREFKEGRGFGELKTLR